MSLRDDTTISASATGGRLSPSGQRRPESDNRLYDKFEIGAFVTDVILNNKIR
jgi:hypothetical protein